MTGRSDEPHDEGLSFKPTWRERLDPARRFHARAYPPGAAVPDEFWQKIELRYPDGETMTLVYHVKPPQEELRTLMLRLQFAAGRVGFRVLVTVADGSTFEAPALP